MLKKSLVSQRPGFYSIIQFCKAVSKGQDDYNQVMETKLEQQNSEELEKALHQPQEFPCDE